VGGTVKPKKEVTRDSERGWGLLKEKQLPGKGYFFDGSLSRERWSRGEKLGKTRGGGKKLGEEKERRDGMGGGGI